MSTSARVLFYAPSLTGDSRIDTALGIAALRLSGEALGNQWGDAVACLAAHMLLISPEDGDGRTRGQIVSDGSDPLAKSYSPVSAADVSLEEAELMRTSPGTQLLTLRRSRGTAGFGVLT